MWKWYSTDEPPPASAGAQNSPKNAGDHSVADLMEQLAQNEQLVLQLKDLIREKDNQLHVKDQQLKEDKEAFEAKISKMKLQTKAKTASLSAQLEDLKKQLAASGSNEQTTGKHKQSTDGEQEHAAANRGKILMLRKKIEELELQVAKKDSELKNKLAELEAQLKRGAEMDMMLAEKDMKMAEKEAYIVELQLAAASSHASQQITQPGEENKVQQDATQETSVSDLQSMVHSLTRKVEESEEKFSLLQEQATILKDQLNKERVQYEEKEAMYMKNICVFQEMIQAKENQLTEQMQKHEQELFLVAAKSDASADLDQLLKALKQKLHEKEEVLLGRTQVVDVLQKELDARDQQIKEMIEKMKLLQLEKDNLEAKLNAEKHVMRAQVRDLMERHEAELKNMKEKHNTELHDIRVKHEEEISQKDQYNLQLQKQLRDSLLCGEVPVTLEATGTTDSAIKRKIEELEEQVKLKTEEAAKSEAKFLKMKAWSKSKIKQAEEDLKNAQTGVSYQEYLALKNRVVELEEEKGELQQEVNCLQDFKAQNEELLAKLELYEEQQQKMQADLEQVAKRATSQTSESGSAEELQSRLIEWQEMVSESARSHAKDERTVMELRMTQIEEEREALVSGQQELEEELGDLRRLGQSQGRRKRTTDAQKLEDDYEYEEKQHFEESNMSMDQNDANEGENLGGLWPEYSSHHTGLRAVVEELEMERNRLQEQILVLEERCQDLEERAQLRSRVEFHQNEAERLQNQLSHLRSQQSRDFEQHQQIVSSLNERLKGVSDRKDYLEASLAEKERVLAETLVKLTQLDKYKESLKAQEITSQDLTGKLLHAEEDLGCVIKKCSAFELECAELKNTVLDLTEKLSSSKEKVQKQETEVEVLRQDLEQTNDELERLNSSHLEERSRLIADLQRCEREIDILKEVIVEKEQEKAALSKRMMEYSEENNTLKEENRYKEQENGELQAALVRFEREIMLSKETRSADEQTMSNNLASLIDQLSSMESELHKAKSEIEAKEKEIVVLLKQIGENDDTIHDLRSELQKQDMLNQAHVAECGPRILTLENKVSVATKELQEMTAVNQKEIEKLKARLAESSSAKEKLDSSLQEKEEKEQCLENELKALKNQCNNLIAENIGKSEELGKLSKQLAEYKEETEGNLQERLTVIAALEQKLQGVDEANSQLMLEVQTKESEREDLKRQMDEMSKLVTDLQNQAKALDVANVQLQATVDDQVRNLTEQATLIKELEGNAVNTSKINSSLQCSIKDMSVENETLKTLLNDKEDELSKQNDVVQQLENKMASEAELVLQHSSTISQLQEEKVALTAKLELLESLEENKSMVEKQLHEKIDECNILKDKIIEHQPTTEQLQGQMQSATVQLEQLQLSNREKEVALSNKNAECTSLQIQWSKGQEEVMELQNRVQVLSTELGNKDVALKERLAELDGMHEVLSQHQLTAKSLEGQLRELTEEGENLRQRLSDKESLLNIKSDESDQLQRQLDQKNAEVVLLQRQMDALNIDSERLQNENKELQTSLSQRAAEHELATNLVQDQAQALSIENCRLKVELEEMKSTVQTKVGEAANLQDLLSQKEEMITSLNKEVSELSTATAKLALELEEKQTSLNQQGILLQQVQAKTLQSEEQLGQYLQLISGLQHQEQVLVTEANQLKLSLQEKEKALQQQRDELGQLQKVAAEHHALEMQSLENMETISKLQNQIQDLTFKSHELECNIEQKDLLLASKVEDCVKLKTVHSEMDDTVCKLREQLTAARSEADVLRSVSKEKELSLSQFKESAAASKEELMSKMEVKAAQNEALHQKYIHLEHSFSQLNNQLNDQNAELNQLRETIAQKEASILERSKLVKRLEDKVSERDLLKSQFNESTELVSELQRQLQHALADAKKQEQSLQEKETAFSHLQERFAVQSEQLKDLSRELSRKNEEIAGLQTILGEKDVIIQSSECNTNTLVAEIESVKEELQKSRASLNDYGNILKHKEEMITVNQKNADSQIAALNAQILRYKEVIQQFEVANQDLKQNDIIVQNKYLEQTQHIESLESQLKTLNEKSTQEHQEKMIKIENLLQQCDQLRKENSALDQDLKTVKAEKEEMDASIQKQLQQKSEELRVLEEKLVRMHEIREELNVLRHLKDDNECLQKQVSLKSEEILKLQFEVQKLEQSLMESERKCLAELNKETEQNSLLTEKLSFLGNQIEAKDAKIDSLQKALNNLQDKFSEQYLQLQTSEHQLTELASNCTQELAEKQSRLDELSALVLSHENAMSGLKLTVSGKEKEIENLKSCITASENTILESAKNMADKLMSFEEEKLLLHNEFSQTKLSHQLELESLQRQIVDLQDKLQKSQGELRERQSSLDDSFQQSRSTQEQLSTVEQELKKKSQHLEDSLKEGAKLFDTLQKKEHEIQTQTMQITQQQELLAALSQQLREKDASTIQLSESISKEVVKAADREKQLTDEMQELKLQNCVSAEKIASFTCELEELKKQLEEQDSLLKAKEDQYQGIVTENEQLYSKTQALTKERDQLKKKFQAALLTRRDLMKKVDELQQSATADVDKSKQMEELQSKCKTLESQVMSSQKEFKELEMHLEVLKQQLLEKDGDINILSETLSSKETFIEQLQKNVSQSEAEKDALSVELFKIIQEKDSSIAQLKSVLTEKEKAFDGERYQFNSNIKALKTALSKISECSDAELPNTSEALGNGSGDISEVVNKLNSLKQEKEHLQKKLQAALLARKETIRKAQEKDRHHKEQLSQQKEEYNYISEKYSTQSKELEDVKEELAAAQDAHQTKLTELEHKRELIVSLEEQLHSVNSLLNDKEQMVEQLKVQLDEVESKMPTLVNQNEVQALENKLAHVVSTLSLKEAGMKSLEDANNQLQQEKEELMSELEHLQVRIVEKSEETEMLKQSIISLERQQQEEKQSQGAEIHWLHNQCQSAEAEGKALRIAPEEAMKDKENYRRSLANEAEDVNCLKSRLLDLNNEKEGIQAQLAAFQVENAELKATLKQSWQSQEAEEDRVCATQLLAVQSELAKVHENLQERENTIKVLEGTLSEKEKLVDELQLQVQKQSIFYEAQSERAKSCSNEVPQRSADSSEEGKSKELMQRKLQAALISRKEALKENKTLKHEINVLTSEKEEILSKIPTLERSLAEMKRQLEPLQQAAWAHQEEKRRLISEVDSAFAEKRNLSAVCESLKHTLEILAQEKQQYSVQLDSLRSSQTAELSEWKTKHDELKREYESLLQSYENISNEMDKMRQIVETTRKEKQEVFFKLREAEVERQSIKRQLEEACDENEKIKEKMRKLAKSKQQRVQELEEEIERINNKLETIAAAKQSHTSELSTQYSQLQEEYTLLKQSYDDLKAEFEKTQKEREHFLNEFNSSMSIIERWQSEGAFHQSELPSQVDHKSQVNKSQSSEVQSLENTLTVEKGEVYTLGQVRQSLPEKLQQLEFCLRVETREKGEIITRLEQEIKACQQETINLNEKVKILEDDKSLLQEELENVQEMSDKVKNEREYLEAELLKNVNKIDQLTEALKALHMQNNSLVNELDCFREEKRHLIKEREAQEVKLVKGFEERLRSARRGKTTSKGETKELQELLKEKQQEIIQLQKDCIKYQELILDLERGVKMSESSCEEMGRKLESVTAKASESERQAKLVQEELASYKVMLCDSRTEAENARIQCLGLTEDLRKTEEKTKAQITEKEKELLEILDQQKKIHHKEMLSYQDKLDMLERDKDRVVAEILELQAEMNGRDLTIKKLRDELNNNLAKLAAFTKSMSSLQDDRDRIIEETRKWEARFQDTIQSMENQVQMKEEMLQKLHEEIKVKSFNLQELQFRTSKLEQTINDLNVGSKDAHVRHQSEVINLKDIIRQHSEKIGELEASLKDKEAVLSKLSQENNYLSTQLSDMSQSVTELKETEQILIKDLAEKQFESHQLEADNEKLWGDLQKQSAISQQLKLMLSSKDAEISKLVSSKDSEISEYVVEIQQQHRRQVDDYEKKLEILHQDHQKGANDLKELEVQLGKVREERDKAVSKLDAFTKSMASLQDDRDRILSEYTQLEQRHLDMLGQKDGIIQESATENNELKQEIRNLLNEMDDLNSENAMFKAQLVKHREELNQVLSLKDNQLKELLQKQLQQIQHLEHEKSNLEEQWKIAQSSLEKSNESLNSVQKENAQILEQFSEFKTVGLQREEDKSEVNERELILLLQQKLQAKTQECEELKKEANIGGASLKELENKHSEVESLAKLKAEVKLSVNSDGKVQEQTEEKLAGLSCSVMEQRLLDAMNENKELVSRTESSEKMLMAVQSERDRLLEDIEQLKIRQTDDLKVKGPVKDQKLRNNNDSSEIMWFKTKVEELEKLLQQAKLQERTEQDLSSCQNELAELRSEKNLLLSESQAIKEQYLATVADRDRQIAELRKLNQEMWTGELGNISGMHQLKPLETVSLLGIENVAEQVKALVLENKQLQTEAQRYLQEIHQKELQVQQLNSKVVQCIEDRSALTSQLKTVSQTLRDTQVRYGDLQNRYYSLERQYQALRSSFQHEEQHKTSEDVPPGAPQERANIIVEIDNLELNELRRRLAESEQRNASAHQELTQLAEMLADEERRRRAAEEALLAAEERFKGLDPLPVRLPPREYTIQLESDEEREALIIDSSEQVVVRKVKRGALSFKRWLRGRSMYCSKLMSARTRSRYLVFAYFVTLHVLVFMCLAGRL